ncbi:MAG TPA: OmpA family protein [Alphaproteobacteria bacterium]|nr:OmpA family protein [Alphaproteobacteria bacterium]
MKKMGLVLLAFCIAVYGQTAQPQSGQPAGQAQTVKSTARVAAGNTPTPSDMYCSGFISHEHISRSQYAVAGWNSPDQSRYAGLADRIFLHGPGFKEGDKFQILRHVKDPNRYEAFNGQAAAIRAAGEVYFELGIVRVVAIQNNTAITVPELSCSEVVPGDIAVPFAEREKPVFRSVKPDAFGAPNGKAVGRIILAQEFDTVVGSKQKVYLNIGSDKGLKVGDYLVATRTYGQTLHDREGGLSAKAINKEDTQRQPVVIPRSELEKLPRRTLGNMIVLNVQPRSATAMILTALQDIHVGDGVEVIDVSDAPVIPAVVPVSLETQTNAPAISGVAAASMPAAAATGQPEVASAPTISCNANPGSVRAGESSTISCNALSPDNRPLTLTFISSAGRVTPNKNVATLDTADVAPGPVSVRATAFDDRQLSASTVTTVTVEAPPQALPTVQKLSEMDFKPNSAYVDNRAKAILDDVALKLQQAPGSSVTLSGAADEKESPKLASQRAQNAMTYLTKSKGIDSSRIQVKTGSTPGHKVEVWNVPAGATAPK